MRTGSGNRARYCANKGARVPSGDQHGHRGGDLQQGGLQDGARQTDHPGRIVQPEVHRGRPQGQTQEPPQGQGLPRGARRRDTRRQADQRDARQVRGMQVVYIMEYIGVVLWGIQGLYYGVYRGK